MKIEKISDNQIKFVLTQSDLQERNIKLTELTYGSEKIQLLFREMMEQAVLECDFHSDNTPLMIEAVPVASDSVMIIVTKVSSPEDIAGKISLVSESRESKRYKQSGLIMPKRESMAEESLSIFSFENLDQVEAVAKRLYNYFSGSSALYKEKKRYFLMLRRDEQSASAEDLEAVMHEYGQKHVSNVVSRYYLNEHGEIIIQKDAVRVLTENL